MSEALNTFTLLVAAHVFADFAFQPKKLVEAKGQAKGMLTHVFWVLLMAFVFTGSLNPWLYLIVVGSHGAMDMFKVHVLSPRAAKMGNDAKADLERLTASGADKAALETQHAIQKAASRKHIWHFLWDQIFHLAMIVVVVRLFPTAFQDGLWADRIPADRWPAIFQAIILVTGGIMVVWVGRIVIALGFKPLILDYTFRFGEEPRLSAFERSGEIIGALERLIIFFLLLIGQPGGVGFLIAAKSILRFSSTRPDDDNEKHDEQAMSEMIIIGTLASFAWGMVFSGLTLWALQAYGFKLALFE